MRDPPDTNPGLHASSSSSHPQPFSAYTVATNGIQLTEVSCPPLPKVPFKSLMLRYERRSVGEIAAFSDN